MRTAGTILLILLLPVLVSAADLININTADAVLLDTLPGIGPTYAQRIIDYRTAHGPFAAIADIQNVSGIGPSTYAQIAPLITVGTPQAAAPSPAATTTAPSEPGRAATYVPPPTSLSLELSGAEEAYLNVPLTLFAKATSKGVVDLAADISWSFGDGSYATGREAQKIYRYPGTYLIVATAADGSTKARAEAGVTVLPAKIRIASVSGDGITLANDSPGRLDVGGWRLVSGTGIFTIPPGTVLLPGSNVLFPSDVTNLPLSEGPALIYPNGITAVRYAATSVQLPAETAGFHIVQTVGEAKPWKAPASEDISLSGTAHETTSGDAPAAANGLAAAGAALGEATATPKSLVPAVFRSPWALGLLGIMALAGGAFILL